jgi:hypothetical protein
LRRVGSGHRITLTHPGEQFLDDWLDRNARVAWVAAPSAWELEKQLLRELSCPLNIRDNDHHPYSSTLRGLRAAALDWARASPVANEENVTRSVRLSGTPH